MRSLLRTASLLSILASSLAFAQAQPQIEVAPVVGAQFFRGFAGPGLGNDQGIQNGVVLGARGGALFADRMRLEIGLEYTPTVAVGIDRFTHILQPHADVSLDLTTGWIRPYVGLGIGLISFFDNDWVGGSVTSLFGETNTGVNPDVEFTGALALGSRFYLGELVDMLDGTVARIDVRDVMYAPRNQAVNYMMDSPGELIAFHNLQFSLSFAWVFDTFGETEAGGYYPEGGGYMDGGAGI